jgi:hypothetical protein
VAGGIAGDDSCGSVVVGDDCVTAPTTPALDPLTGGTGVADVDGPAAEAWASAPAASKVAVWGFGAESRTSPRPNGSDAVVEDPPLTRARRVGVCVGASSGFTRPNYPVLAGAIIIGSTRESGVPG